MWKKGRSKDQIQTKNSNMAFVPEVVVIFVKICIRGDKASCQKGIFSRASMVPNHNSHVGTHARGTRTRQRSLAGITMSARTGNRWWTLRFCDQVFRDQVCEAW
jgi:hypothetical protein